MALFEEQITDTLETGAPSIKYEGDEGPQDPRQEQMLAQLKQEYMQYVFEMKELQEPVMSFEEWYQSVYKASQMGVQAPQEDITAEEVMMREPAAYGGIMDTESGRRAYGLGSFFKKITKPIKKIGSKLVGGAKKLIKSPLGKAALLYAGTMGIPGTQFKGLSGLMKGKALPFDWAGKAAREQSGSGLMSLAKKAFSNPKTLAKIGIGAASALPLLGIGTEAKQDQIENFSQSGDWDENFKSAGGFPGMRRAIARAKDQAELESLADQFGFTPGLFPQVAADGGRIGYAGGEIVEKIKEGIMEGGRRGMGAPFIDEAIWIEKIKDFIRKKRGDPREEMTEEEIIEQSPMRPMPEMPRRQPYALGSKADFAIEDVLTGGVEDEIGGITGIMRQADLQRKGNVGQFYAADGGMPMMMAGGIEMDANNEIMERIIDDLMEADPSLSMEKAIEEARKIFDQMASGPMARPRTMAREGGIMDLGGMEKDYRETGGFVDLGAEEKADDVPARLSVNEFVMTADAVRGAGDGDIDLGAERMEDVMKQLEQKGKRNQGAEDMFEVSERLSEVV